MEACIECAEADGGALQCALDGSLHTGAAGLKPFARMGDGLAWIVVEDGGGERGDLKLSLTSHCRERVFKAQAQIVESLGGAVQKR